MLRHGLQELHGAVIVLPLRAEWAVVAEGLRRGWAVSEGGVGAALVSALWRQPAP